MIVFTISIYIYSEKYIYILNYIYIYNIYSENIYIYSVLREECSMLREEITVFLFFFF